MGMNRFIDRRGTYRLSYRMDDKVHVVLVVTSL